MRVSQLSYNCDPDLKDPDALLARYETMVGWSDAISAAGALVTVFQRFPATATLSRGGVTYRFGPSPTDALFQASAASDIAHIHGIVFSGEAPGLRRRLPGKTAIVIQNHGSLPETKGGLLAPLRKYRKKQDLAAADALLFAAEDQGVAWRTAGFIDEIPRTYAVMPASSNFVERPRTWARAESGMDGDPAILWVGRLDANKDPLTVLAAFEEAVAHLPAATLTMVYGDETLLPQVRERVAGSATLPSKVRLVGKVAHERLPAFYSAADLFVVGSHYENSGFSLIEACACGVTPVVTSIPSFRAICGEAVGEALWTPGDAEACARALRAAAARVSDRRRDWVRRHFERSLSWKVIGRRAMDVYLDVVARRSAATRVLH